MCVLLCGHVGDTNYHACRHVNRVRVKHGIRSRLITLSSSVTCVRSAAVQHVVPWLARDLTISLTIGLSTQTIDSPKNPIVPTIDCSINSIGIHCMDMHNG